MTTTTPLLKRNLIVMGVSGSGKTTIGEALAAHFGTTFLEGDKLHPAANVAKMSAGIPLDDADRKPWLEAIAARLAESDDGPAGIVAACSSLKRSYRTILTSATRRRTTFVFLDGSLALLRERMNTRKGHFMPASLLDSQLATLERPGADEDVLIIDLDGDIDAELAATIAKIERDA
ncbi:gluconate kinase, SKI family [Kaistia soli DSM 19436]|uniref:Gluconokinase n=1 Tax=Kaistia soli DSM 19436 TaxID=1122133 RepID=A0A1M5MF66_9HYPH|nr:gluconokinase [Kaistia soli]SHG75945.1 gluconate kinase, SKI family [Kaistia soli DSM 19436]